MSFNYQEMSSAFEYPGDSNKAVLLIHGFLASPYIMRSMGKVLNAEGYHVKAICLPGHGTDFKALKTVGFEDWKNTIDEAFLELKAKYAEVLIVGFSIGAILGLITAFEHNAPRVIALSPAFEISNGAKALHTLTKLHLGFLLPDLFCTQSEKINLGSYTRFPAFSVTQVYRAITYYKKLLHEQTHLPKIYVAASTDDATVRFEGVIEAMNHYQEGSHFRIYSGDPTHVDAHLHGQNKEVIDVCEFGHVISFSHVAIPVSPDDPYFGKNGAYYGKLAENIKFGEPTWRDKGKAIKRLTYNPDFKAMTDDMLAWLKEPIH